MLLAKAAQGHDPPTGVVEVDPLAVVNHCIEDRATTKTTKYNGRTSYPFVPLIITTGGTMNELFRTLTSAMLKVSRRPLRSEISTLLLRYSTMITALRND